MKIYLDENLSSEPLAGILTSQGHSVDLPQFAGKLGKFDQVHLEFAIRNLLVMLTKDCDDFTELHQLVLTAGGEHPGILLAYYVNDANLDMKPKHIARAIANVEKSRIDLTNQLVILNQWR